VQRCLCFCFWVPFPHLNQFVSCNPPHPLIFLRNFSYRISPKIYSIDRLQCCRLRLVRRRSFHLQPPVSHSLLSSSLPLSLPLSPSPLLFVYVSLISLSKGKTISIAHELAHQMNGKETNQARSNICQSM